MLMSITTNHKPHSLSSIVVSLTIIFYNNRHNKPSRTIYRHNMADAYADFTNSNDQEVRVLVNIRLSMALPDWKKESQQFTSNRKAAEDDRAEEMPT